MMRCERCGRPVSNDYVAMVDECPRCHATPFVERAEHDRDAWARVIAEAAVTGLEPTPLSVDEYVSARDRAHELRDVEQS